MADNVLTVMRAISLCALQGLVGSPRGGLRSPQKQSESSSSRLRGNGSSGPRLSVGRIPRQFGSDVGLDGRPRSFGGLAVFGFFVVSGFLVTRSFDGSPNFLSYIWKRFLRIFPGFWVCLLVTVLVFAPLAFWFEHDTLQGYLHTHTDSPSGYLKNNALLSMNQYNIDDLLGNNPYAHIHAGFQAWDGSLWTLIYEFKCYLGVMVLGMIGVFRKWRPTVLVLSLGLWALQLQQHLHPGYLQGTFLLGDPEHGPAWPSFSAWG